VQQPNAHLFIQPIIEAVETATTPVPVVDEEKCTLCRKCGEICQFKAIVVIGEVNAFRKQLEWFRGKHRIEIRTENPTGPLKNKTVLITRAASQASSLKSELVAKGAQVIEFPVIKIAPPRSWKPLDRALRGIGSYDWVVFTSVNAVSSVMQRLLSRGGDSRRFAGIKFAVIGKMTAAAAARASAVATQHRPPRTSVSDYDR